MAIKVTQSVYDGIVAVRDSGATNMLARDVVIQLCEEMGFADAAQWIRNHKPQYAEGVFHGFEITEEEGGTREDNEC